MGFLFNHDEDLKERDEEQKRQLKRGTVPDATIGDVGQAVKSSIYDTGAMANAGIRAVTGSKAAEFREKRDQLKSEKVTQHLSPGGRAMAAGTVLPNEEGDSAFLQNPIGYVVFNGAKQAPMIAISAIPGAAIGRGLMATAKMAKYAKAATTATTATMGGVLNTGDVLQNVYTELDKMTKKDWSKVPAYLKLVSQGLNYEEASNKIKDDLVANSAALAFGLGTILNTFGVGQQLAKSGAGVAVKEGFIKGLGKGAGKEFVQEFAEEGSGNLIAQSATKFGDNYDWKQALEAASSGGVVGGVIGGGVGGVTNIKTKTPQVPVVQPGNAPSVSQAAAVTGAPLPPPAPPKTSPTVPAVNVKPPVGPPVVGVGAHTPPPAVKPPARDMKKKKKGTTVPVVEASVIPDQNQKAAIVATTPPPVIQVPPEIPVPPPAPPVTQNVTITPPPIIRKRAQADIIPPVVAQAPQVVVPTQQVVASTQQVVPPPPVEQVPPESTAARLPQVLPDLQARALHEAEVARAAAEPDMSARGVRYDLGQNAEEVNNPAQHQAWRRLMRREATRSNPSPIVREAAGIVGKVGQSMTEAQKDRLQELHSQWIDVSRETAARRPEIKKETKPPVGQRKGMAVGNVLTRIPEEFIKAVAEDQNSLASGDDSAATEQRARNAMEILQGAPDRPEMMEAINNSPYVKAAVDLINKIEQGRNVPKAGDYFAFHDAEKALLKSKDEIYTPEIKAEMDRKTESLEKKSLGGFDAVVAETAGVRESVPVSGTFGAASEGRRVEVSAEEKAALAAKYNTKPKSKEEVAAATPKPAKPEVVTQRVTPPPAPTPAKKAVAKIEKRKADLGLAGQDLLDLRRKQQAAARSGDPQLEELMHTINGYRAGIKVKFGQAALDRTNKEVEAMLANEKRPAMIARGGSPKILQQLRNRRTAGTYEDKHGVMHQATRTTDVKTLLAELKEEGGFNKLIANGEIAKTAFDMMLPRLLEMAGDVTVHLLPRSSSVFRSDDGRTFAGMYDSIKNVIVLDVNNDNANGWSTHVAVHEIAHAAFYHQLRDPYNQYHPKLLEYFRVGVKDMFTDEKLKEMGVKYGFTNVDELIAETWSNPTFQRFLADIALPDELARKMGLGRFKKYSVWSGFVELVRRVMGFAPGTNNGLDFVMAATHQMASVHPNASTMINKDNETYWENLYGDISDIPAFPNTSEYAPIAQMQNTILQAAKEKSSTGFFRNLQLKTVTLHQLAQMADKVFPEGMAMKLSDIVGSISVRRQELMSGGRDKVVALAHEMSLKHKGPVFEKFIDITDRATSAGVNVAVALTHPDNLHIKKGFAHSNARAVHKELHGEWQNLPQDLKDLWNKSGAFFKDAQDTLALNQLNNVVEIALNRKDAALALRIHEGFMTEADKALFQTNEAMRIIAETKELKKIRGYYSPKMRRGDHVLTGEYIMPSQFDTKRDKKTGRYMFDTKADAMAFQDEVRKLGLPVLNTKTYSVDATTGKKHYTYTDPVTGVTNLGPDRLPKLYRFSRGDTGSKEVFEVNVQTKLVEFFDNKQKGLAAEEQYRSDGKYTVNGLQQREDLTTAKPIVSTSQMIRLKKSMAAHDKYQKMSAAQQELLKQALNELSLSFLSSTAVQNRSKPRRNVLGASREYARNVAEYSATSASAIAQAEKAPELAKAVTDLEEYAETNKGQTSSLTYPRSEILAQLRSSVDNQEYKKPTNFNAVINWLLRVAFLKHLASPAYVMLNMTQPFMLTLPTIGGRHGVVRSSMALTKAYNDIGFLGIMGAGIRDTMSATRDLVTGMTTESADYIGDLHKRLAKAADGKELTDMLDYLYDIGIINRDAGIEIAELINKPGVLAHVGRSMEHIARQTSVAAEVINRAATAVAAFRLERARGASYEAARAYTQKVVANTQGIYSYANAPEYFKHPVMAIPLQFRKYSQLYYNLLANMVHQTFKGATRTEKIEAGKQLGIMFMTHVAMAGALGLPTEPLKVIFGTLAWMSLPIPTWEEVERGATQYSMDMFGDNFGDALVHGLPRLAGIDIHSRVGANSMLLFGTPEEADADDWYAWTAKTAMGAPGGVVTDMFKAKEALEDGDLAKAAGLMIPVKVISDSIKAAENYTVGKKNAKGKQTQEPSGLTSAAIKAFGFKPAWIARQEEATNAYYSESRGRDTKRQGLIDTWKNSSGAGRRAAQKEITKFNKTVPKDAKITGATLARSLKADKNYSKHGIYPGRRNIDLLERFLGD